MRIIAGEFKNHSLLAPKGDSTRPTSSQLRETIFNICQQRIAESLFLDLFAGSGSVGLEAISRGAQHSTFIESNPIAFKCIKQNIDKLNVQAKTRVLPGDVFVSLKKLHKNGDKFSIIFADPPYNAFSGKVSFGLQTLLTLDQLDLLRDDGVIFIEDAKGNISEEQVLTSLILVNARTSGRTTLFQYKKS